MLGSSNPQKSLVGGVLSPWVTIIVMWYGLTLFVGFDLYRRFTDSSFLREGPVGWFTNRVLPRSDGGVTHVLHVTP